MGKYFAIAFILFLTVCGYIIFNDEEKVETTAHDKHIEAVNQKEIMTKNSEVFDKYKIEEDKKEVISEIENKIKNKSNDIESIISQADKLIEDNNLDTSNIKKASNERVDKVNKKYQELKKELENLN